MSQRSTLDRAIAVVGITLALLLLGCADGTAALGPSSSSTAGAPPSFGVGEPTFGGGSQSALWADDFEGTANTAALFARYTTQSGESGVHVDATGGLQGSRAIRVDWRTRAGCADDSHLLERAFPAAARDVIVQYSVRYTPGFAFDWSGNDRCSGNAKKLFFLWAAQGSRFDFISENHVLGVGSDLDHPLFAQNIGGALRPDDLADGSWHRITLRIRQSSTPTATDGSIHGWIDGAQRWAVTGIASNASGGWVLFKLPTTFNQGSPRDQSEWIDDLRIWTP